MSEVDLSEFYAMSYKKPCRVQSALGLLKPADKAKLEAALAEDAGRIPNAVVGRWIKEKCPQLGAALPSDPAILRHRKKECSCD